MGGIPGNFGDVAFALQSAKGAPAAVSQWRTRLQGGSMPHVTPTKSDFEETTGLRMRKDSFYSSMQVDGSWAMYVRPECLVPLLYGVLGAKSSAAGEVAIATSSIANPSLITTSAAHGLVTGQTATIAGHSGATPAINDDHVVTVVSPTTFTIPINVTVGGTGGTVDNGTTTHTVVPSAVLPYLTFWRRMGSNPSLMEVFPDCVITALTVTSDAGMPLLVTPTIIGLAASYLTSATAMETAAIETAYGLKHDHGEAGYKVAGTAIRSLRRHSLSIDNGAQPQPGDSLFPDDVAPGLLSVAVEGEMTMEDFSAYNLAVYGSASPANAATPASGPVAIGAPGIDFTWTHPTAAPGRSLRLLVPNVQQDPVDPQPNVSGEPLSQALTWRAYQPDSDPAISLLVKNGTAAYAAA